MAKASSSTKKKKTSSTGKKAKPNGYILAKTKAGKEKKKSFTYNGKTYVTKPTKAGTLYVIYALKK